MTTARTEPSAPASRPLRADAQRNRDKLVATAREAFTEEGSAASLEEIARRAGVGIGTLYRNFATRQDLLEAVYLEEVEAICRGADDLGALDPWDALSGWLHHFVRFAATKRVLADELIAYIDRDAGIFKQCGDAITAAGAPLLERAQDAGVVRPDAVFTDVARMVGGIAAMRNADPEQVERVLAMALDGLRYRPAAA